MPLNWLGDVEANNSIVSNPSCSNIANLAGSITCSYIVQNSLGVARITVSSLSTGTLDNSKSFSFQANSILTPPFKGSTQTVKIYSQWPDLVKID